MAELTGKSVAIIGGGPMGLSAAYFLRQKGHDVTIFDAMPKLGGMMRYGIPEYRLPKEVLDAEIDIIESMGVEIIPNTKIGEDISFDTVRADYDAVLVGIGAWVSTGVHCKGEDADGVIGGIDFLRRIVRNEHIDFGRKIAIVGGGNTAMDACRSDLLGQRHAALGLDDGLRTGPGLQDLGPVEGHQTVPEDHRAVFVHHAQAVGVPVEGEPDVRPRGLDLLDQVLEVLALLRVQIGRAHV